MTRRMVFALVIFTAVVITGAMLPLALNTIAHDRSSFIQATQGLVRTDAAVAQTRLEAIAQSGSIAKAKPYAPLIPILNEAGQDGDRLLILKSRRIIDRAGQPQTQQSLLIEKGRMPAGDWRQLADQADALAGASAQPVTETTGSWVVAATPVYSGSSVLVGTVILARSSASLNRTIVALWVILATIGLVALVGATLLAFALVRWVSRPLAGLTSAAGRLADGDLESRAVVDSGPPELRRLAATFNTMAGRLEALVHGNRAVIADVSHQLRTPLAALRLRRAFLRFTTSNPNGTGLGLAIVHRLATANGGAARLAETPGGGLTAILDFPAGPAPSAGRPESGSAAPPAQDFISR